MAATPQSDADRIASYNAKIAATTVGLKIAAMLPDMKVNFAAFANEFVAIQLLVRAELGTDATIFPLTYGGYYAYASQLWKLLKTTTQPAVDAVAQIIKIKWLARGLNDAMLIKIALNVFSITVV